MKKSICIVLAAATLTLGSVWAHRPSDCGGKRFKNAGHGKRDRASVHMISSVLRNPELLKECRITEEQLHAIDQMVYEHEMSMIDLRAAEKKSSMALRRLMQSDSVDETKLDAALTQCSQAELAVKKSEMMMMLQLRNMVGEDTLKKVKQTFRAHRNRKDCDGENKCNEQKHPAHAPAKG